LIGVLGSYDIIELNKVSVIYVILAGTSANSSFPNDFK